jgi:prepilin-type N-terminal cleavage/methylation domain-containing protein
MNTNISKTNKGFTIIEVLIVLAIAGLIMLVVLLAVPGLQRTQANTAAKTDATHIAAALTSYTSNNNGVLPTASTVGTVYTDVSGLSKLTATNSASGTLSALATAPVNNTWYFNTGGFATGAANGQEWVVDIDVTGVCPASTYAPTITTTTGTSTQVALLYTTQTSGTNSNWNCIQAQ